MQWRWHGEIVTKIPLVFGVTLFFVLSGFLITRILINQKNKPIKASLKAFYMRRFFRIFPLYYLVIFIAFLFGYQEQRELIPWLATYTLNIYHSLNPGVNLGDFWHLWSLAVEEQFYLIWPLLVFLIPLNRFLKMAIILVLLSLAYKVFVLVQLGSWMEADNGFLSNFYSLGLGGVLGYLSLERKALFTKVGDNKVLFTLAFLCVLTVGYRVVYPEDAFFKIVTMQLVWVLFFVSLIAKVSTRPGGIYKWFLENPAILYMGKISYGIYVIHLFVPSLFYYFAPHSIFVSNSYIGFFGFFGTTVILASISWFLFEKPILKLKKRWEY